MIRTRDDENIATALDRVDWPDFAGTMCRYAERVEAESVELEADRDRWRLLCGVALLCNAGWLLTALVLLGGGA